MPKPASRLKTCRTTVRLMPYFRAAASSRRKTAWPRKLNRITSSAMTRYQSLRGSGRCAPAAGWPPRDLLRLTTSRPFGRLRIHFSWIRSLTADRTGVRLTL